MADIVKGKIGNALESVAPDHILGVANDIYDEELEMYQADINKHAGVFNISIHNASGGTPATYASLTDALGVNGANVPETSRQPGMSIKFILATPLPTDPVSYSYKYVQYRLMHALDNASTASADFANTANWQGVDDEPIAGSDNLVKSGGVSKAIDLFSLPMANKVIKELYMPNVDYQNVKNITICIAAARTSGTYYNVIRFIVSENGSNVTRNFYSKSFQTQEEAIEDIPNIPTFIDSVNGMMVLNAIDSSMAGTKYWLEPVSINKDISLLSNAPIINSHVSRLFEGSDVRKFLIGSSSGKLGMSDGQSYITTVNVIPGKKYKIVNELYSAHRYLSFSSDSTGQIVIPHEVNGDAVAISSYGRGVTIRTAPVGAKYIHLQTQYDGDTDSFPYVTVFEVDEDVEEFKKHAGVFNISIHNASGGTPATYASLTDALGVNGANVPETSRQPGMSIKFILATPLPTDPVSYSYKYVQYRLTANDWSTDVADWKNYDVGNVIENAEMDEVLGGEVAVFLTDAKGNAVLDENGKPIEII